jgi:hypothetical protein
VRRSSDHLYRCGDKQASGANVVHDLESQLLKPDPHVHVQISPSTI